MVKILLKRALIGAPFGVLLTKVLAIVISIGIGDGIYYPIVPEMAQCFGNELNAVIIQTLVTALMGAAFCASSVIWNSDRLGLLMQTIIHFVIICGVYVAVAYVCFWMEHNVWSVAGYVIMFAAIYAVIWIVQYVGIKRKINKMNEIVAKR